MYFSSGSEEKLMQVSCLRSHVITSILETVSSAPHFVHALLSFAQLPSFATEWYGINNS